MAYIGKQPTVGNFVKLDAITATATTTFNLLNGGVAYSPQSANHCLVSLNGILQAPTDSFTISGSTIIFSSALTVSDVIDFIIVLGDVLNIGTPSDATVGFSKVTSNLITGATAVTAPATDDVLLCYDTSATALRKITFADFGNTPAFEATLSADQSLADGVATKVQFNTEVFDTDNCYDNSVNYRFTPTVAGKYFVYTNLRMEVNAESIEFLVLYIRKNGSDYFNTIDNPTDTSSQGENMNIGISIDFNGSSDYIEIFAAISHGAGSAKLESGTISNNFGAYRLIGA